MTRHFLRSLDRGTGERASGVSKYNNLGRALVGIRDLRGVAWLITRSRRTAVEER